MANGGEIDDGNEVGSPSVEVGPTPPSESDSVEQAQANLAEIDPKRLRSVVEFVLSLVRHSKKTRPPLVYPRKLDRYAKAQRVPNSSLGGVLRVIEGDPAFRSQVGAHLPDGMVDEVGTLWLERPDGWEATIRTVIAAEEQAEVERSLEMQLKKSEKRRDRAEEATARVTAELIGRDQAIDELAGQVADHLEQLESVHEQLELLRDQLTDARNGERHARDREAAAQARLAAAVAQIGELEAEQAHRAVTLDPHVDAATEAGSSAGEQARKDGPTSDREDSAAPADSAEDGRAEDGRDEDGLARDGRARDGLARDGVARDGVARDGLGGHGLVIAELAQVAADLAVRLASLGSDATATTAVDSPTTHQASRRRAKRQPLRMPGGVYSESSAGGLFLLRSGAHFFIDGYNVSKLAWPSYSLIRQRDRLTDLVDQLCARCAPDIGPMTIVFDGADVVGAHTHRRRQARVVYSAPGQIADDRIRDEVARLDAETAVVVVTNDREIIDDVKRAGANVMSSELFLEIAMS